MYKLNFKKRVWIVKKRIQGVSASKLALAQRVSESYVRRLTRIHKEFGWDGLKDHKTGRPETILNQNSAIIILDLRKRYKYGACNIEQILKRKGFAISHRQIEKVLVRNGLVTANPRKQRPRKWVRYELPHPNDLWHTDWSHDPFTDQNLSVYIDDRTRLIISYGLFKSATADNSIALLRSGIAEFGKPKAVMTDHGSQYYGTHPNSIQEKTQFRQFLDPLGIRHCLARVNRPQTNGKVERFFRTYKEEFITETFSSIHDFIKHYNEKRLHMSLHYKTPREVWDELKRN